MSDSYLTIPDAQNGSSIELQTKPGKNKFSLITTGGVNKILLDGKSINYSATPKDNVINFTMDTPEIPAPEINYGQIRFKEDDAIENNSDFKNISYIDGVYPTLDSLDEYQNGYFIYKGKFELKDKQLLKASYYSNDWHSIYIDGKLVQDLTGNTFNDFSEINLSKGTHDIKIIYENKGRPNFGFMEEKKGIKSLTVLAPKQYQQLTDWKYLVQMNEQPESNPSETHAGYNDSNWMNFEPSYNAHETRNDKQVGSWYRKKIDLTSEEAGNDPRLIFEGISRSTTIYANGKQVFKYKHNGWDGPFEISVKGAVKSGNNLIAVYVENEKGRGGIIGPIEFEYGKAAPLKLNQFTYHASSNGKLNGWQKPDYDDSEWRCAKKIR